MEKEITKSQKTIAKTAKVENTNSISKIIFFGIFIFLSVAGTYKSVFYGFDSDESYNITLAYRLLLGDHLFKEMWELHQTSAIFMAPFIWIFKAITGSMEAVAVYLRGVGCLVQFIVSLFFYKELKEHIKDIWAFFLSIIIYNYSPKFIQVLEYSFLEYLLFICFVVFCLRYFRTKKDINLVGIGVVLAGCVLSYPLAVVAVVPVYISLYFLINDFSDGKPSKENHRIKPVLIILLTDALLGIAFLIIILSKVSVGEMIENVGYIMSDGSHSASIIDRIKDLVYSAWDNYKELIFVTLLTEIIRRLVIYLGAKEKIKASEGYLLSLEKIYLLVALFLPLMKVFHVMKNWGFIYLYSSFFILSLIGGFLYIKIAFRNKNKWGRVTYIIILALSLMFVMSHLGSNLDLHVNAGLLLPVLIVLMADSQVMCDTKDTNTLIDSDISLSKLDAYKVAFTVLLVLFVVFRLVCVRVAGTMDYTIFDSMPKAMAGALKYSHIPENQLDTYVQRYRCLSENVQSGEGFMYIGSDKYLYNSLDVRIDIPSTISSPTFDEKIVIYFDKYPYKKPQVILAELEYADPNRFEGTAFGRFLNENYVATNYTFENNDGMVVYFEK